MTAPDLAPCPFCGATGTKISLFSHSVRCANCGTGGPRFDNEAEALAAWNTRPALSSPIPTDRARAIEECAVAAMSPAQGERLPPLYRLAQKESAAAIRALLTTQPSEEGWIKIDADHPLPDDLKVGDEIMNIEIIVGHGWQERGPPLAYRRASGER